MGEQHSSECPRKNVLVELTMSQITFSFNDIKTTKNTTAEEVVAAKVEQFNEVRQELRKIAFNPDLKASVKKEANAGLLQIEYFITGMQKVLEFQRGQVRQQTQNEHLDREIEERFITAESLAKSVIAGYTYRPDFSYDFKADVLYEVAVVNRRFALLKREIGEALRKSSTDWSDRVTKLEELQQQMKTKVQELAQL